MTVDSAMSWFNAVVPLLGGVLLVYLVLLLLLWLYARKHPGTVRLGDALRVLPDFLVFLGRLARDRNLPKRSRVALLLLLIYLASPIDVVPDFIPLIGYADDILIVALVLRLVVRTAGKDVLLRNWTGSEPGRRLVEQLAGITTAEPTTTTTTPHNSGL